MNWSRHLTSGEKLLWEGRPVPGFFVRTRDVIDLAISLALLALLWNFIESGSVLFVFLGAVLAARILFSQWVLGPLLRLTAHYALTSRRALIASNTFGGRIFTYDLTQETPIRVVGTGTPSIFFTENDQGGPVGFIRIRDADRVRALLSDIKGKPA